MVIYNMGEMISWEAVGFQQDCILLFVVLKAHFAANSILHDGFAFERHFETNHIRATFGLIFRALFRCEIAMLAVITVTSLIVQSLKFFLSFVGFVGFIIIDKPLRPFLIERQAF